MSNDTVVIFIKTNWCGYCTRFTPIFEKTKKNNLKKYNFEVYDLAEENSKDKNMFNLKHNNSQDLIDGYPTVLIKKNNKYIKIEHTIINNKDEDEDEDTKIEEASVEFINNIEKGIKNIEAKEGQVFVGGNYKKKYYKYKKKYLITKNNM